MKPVALVTCMELPEPDFDQELLLFALEEAGVPAGLLPWDDPTAEAGEWGLCILRSCWNYPEDPDGFLRWLKAADAASRVLNPARAIRWNIHKRYLRELEARGVPIIPTAWFERGRSGVRLDEIMDRRLWSEVVVKPAVSAGSFRTRRIDRDSATKEGQLFTDALVRDRDVMVQRYMADAERTGERALVWIDGKFTHSVIKHPRFEGDDERVSNAVPISDAELALGTKVIACVGPEHLLYARVDLVRDDEGSPLVSEFELMEPSLFLLQHEPALKRLVQAIKRLHNR